MSGRLKDSRRDSRDDTVQVLIHLVLSLGKDGRLGIQSEGHWFLQNELSVVERVIFWN